MTPVPGQDPRARAAAELLAAAAALEGPDRAVIAFGRDGRVAHWSPRATTMTGWSSDAVRGRQLAELVQAASRGDVTDVLTSVTDGHRWTARLDLEGPRAGALRVELSTEPIHVDELVVGAVGVLRPLTTAHAERSIRELSAVLGHVREAIVVGDEHGRVTELNPAAERILGWSRTEMLGTPLDRLVPASDIGSFRRMWDQLASGRTVPPYRALRRDRAGSEYVVTVHAAAIRDHGTFAGAVAKLQPVPAQEPEDRVPLPEAVAASPALSLVTFDLEGTVTYAHRSGPGVGPEDPVGQKMQDLWGEHPAALRGLASCLEGHPVDLGLEHAGRWWDVHFCPRHDPDGLLTGGSCIAHDVTGRIGPPREQQVGRGPGEDDDALAELQGVAALHRRLADPLASGHGRAVAIVALEGLELLTTEEGDGQARWVRHVLTTRVQRVAAPADAFHGPDGTVALVLDAARVRDDIAGIIHDVQSAVGLPVDRPSGDDVHLAARVGVAVSDSAPLANLLRSAEHASRQALAGDHPDLRWFAADQPPRRLKPSLVADLRHAMPRDELRLHYQPIVAVKTGRPLGAEALVRWQHPQEGLLPPSAFVRLAENAGLIHEIGTWVARTACETAAALAAEGTPSPFQVAVNVSALQLMQDGFADLVAQLLAETGCPAALVSIEVTETTLAVDMDAAVATLHALKELGVKLALDDFGTGYSSLLYLKHFPVDTIKIDQSFVAGLGVHEDDGAIVASTVSLAHRIGVTCVAEGVETVAQLKLLRKMGCDYAQGYLFSRPMPGEALRQWLQEQHSKAPPTVATPPVSAADAVEILRMHEEGASPHTIAAALNVSGKRTPLGTRWHAASVAAVVARAAYPHLDLRQRSDPR